MPLRLAVRHGQRCAAQCRAAVAQQQRDGVDPWGALRRGRGRGTSTSTSTSSPWAVGHTAAGHTTVHHAIARHGHRVEHAVAVKVARDQPD